MIFPAEILLRLENIIPGCEKLSSLAQRHRKELFLGGGALRDLLRGSPLHDLDFACRQEELGFWREKLPDFFSGHFISMGARATQFQTSRLVGTGNLTVDLAALEGSRLESDLRRRDFTINAMAFGLHDQTFHDPFAGRRDLENREIVIIAAENLTADPLRIVRAARFMLELEGSIPKATRLAMTAAVPGLSRVAGERFTVELNHIFAHPESFAGLEILATTGALQTILPPLAGLQGLRQNNYHHLDALQHTLAMGRELDHLCRENPLGLPDLDPDSRILLKWAGLLHDTGKAMSRTMDPDTGIIHFYGHERFSTHLAREALQGFALGKQFLTRLERLIENHLRPLQLSFGPNKEKSLRRLVFDLEDDLGLLLLHALADLEATRGRDPAPRREALLKLSRKLLTIYKEERKSFIKPLLNGRDLIALGMEPGPGMGVVIKLIHQRQIAGEIENRDQALAAARQLLDDKKSS
jgi:tRNA nucleotidyltransferase/poly(A) polymerase